MLKLLLSLTIMVSIALLVSIAPSWADEVKQDARCWVEGTTVIQQVSMPHK